MSFLRLFQNLLLYVVLIYMVLNKGMSISDFVLYIGLVASFSTAMTDMFCNMVWMNMNRMELDDFRTFMDWNEDKPDIEKGQGVSKNIGLKQFEFKFENVSFKYPGHEKYVAKVCYEIGNRHAPLFWGENDTFITIYNEPMLLMLQKLHGVTAEKELKKLDFDQRISASIHNHHH